MMNPLFSQGHACIIGVGADLPNTITDANGLADILKDPERCAYPPEQVQVLTEQQATRAAVLTALDQLAQRTTPDSTAIVYFSGHGYKVSHPLVGDRYFLMPYGYDLKALPATTIAGDEFVAKLRAIPAKKLLLLLDCCHAGGLGDLSDQGVTTEKAPLPPEAQALFEKGKGRIVIASSAAHEKSFAGKPYSAFTLAVIEALAGQGASVKDGYVRVADLAMYTGKVVPNRTQERQNPMLNFEGADNFFLAYYAGGEKEPKGLPYAGEPEVELEAAQPTPTQVYISHQTVTQTGERNFNMGMNFGQIHQGDRTYYQTPHPPTKPTASESPSPSINQQVQQRGEVNVTIDHAEGIQIGDR